MRTGMRAAMGVALVAAAIGVVWAVDDAPAEAHHCDGQWHPPEEFQVCDDIETGDPPPDPPDEIGDPPPAAPQPVCWYDYYNDVWEYLTPGDTFPDLFIRQHAQEINDARPSPEHILEVRKCPHPHAGGVDPETGSPIHDDAYVVDTWQWVPPGTAPGLDNQEEQLREALYAEVRGRLPQPAITTSPPQGMPSVVTLPVFVHVDNWVAGFVAGPQCAGPLCVTATVEEPSMVFEPGEPGSSPVTCDGPGTLFDPNGPSPAVQAEGACAYAYQLRTGVNGRPQAWQGEVSTTWEISWESTLGGSPRNGGDLPSITTTAGGDELARRVVELQAIVSEVVVGGRG